MPTINKKNTLTTNNPKGFSMLDRNEQPHDIGYSFKEEVLSRLKSTEWNRYPTDNYRSIEKKIADNCGLLSENIVLGSGSANIITTLLNYYALNNKDIIIAQPSYGLFDFHCRTYNIDYTPWFLTSDLEYDLKSIPKMTSNSVLLITTPNNPVGNSLSYEELDEILTTNPLATIIIDAVYFEFGSVDSMPLLKKHKNMIILRSFSKAFPLAGVRLGYLCAAPEITSVIRKLILQYSINHLSIVAAETLVSNDFFLNDAKKRVNTIKTERARLEYLINTEFDKNVLQAVHSEGNFLLVRVASEKTLECIMQRFDKKNIKVLNTSNFPLLNNSFRISIGSRQENDKLLLAVISACKKCYE